MRRFQTPWLLLAICLGVVAGGVAGWLFPRVTHESAGLISPRDFDAPAEFAQRLLDRADPASEALYFRLASRMREKLDAWDSSRKPSEDLLAALSDNLNHILREESLWTMPGFDEAARDEALRERIERGPEPSERVWINRMLVEAAFPGLIEPNPLRDGEPVEGLAAVSWLGHLWLNLLMMLVVPLVMASMISGVANLGDVRRLGRAGSVTVLYYLTTTGIAVLIGIILVNIMRPGLGVSLPMDLSVPAHVEAKRDMGMIQIIESLVTPNLFKAMAERDILPLIIFSLVFGAVLTTLGEAGRRVIRLAEGINEAILKMVHLVILLAPVGLFCLVAARLAEAGSARGIALLLVSIGKYALTVLIGLGIHGFIVLPLILLVLARKNPLTYVTHFIQALLTAFSTASSSATLPLTMQCAEEKAKVPRRSGRFVLPLGATINMDGTALYEAVAVMFIAQVFFPDRPLPPGDQAIIFITATLAAIGAAGIPEAGLVTMVIVLSAVGLPLEGTALILPIDWLLDRFRTTVNVWGDCVGASVVERHGFKDPPGGGAIQQAASAGPDAD